MSLIEEKCLNQNNELPGSGSFITIKNIVNPGNQYILTPEDSGCMLLADVSVIKIPLGLPVGFNVSITQVNATNQVRIEKEDWTPIMETDGKFCTAKQYAVVSLINVGSNDYLLSGLTGDFIMPEFM